MVDGNFRLGGPCLRLSCSRVSDSPATESSESFALGKHARRKTAGLPWIICTTRAVNNDATLSCKNFSLAPAVSVLLGQKIFTGQNGNKSSCGTSGTLTAA
ncbi:hypothetical protein HZ326_16311, partial [Fusarium oxysporum f. sp. albedinis]